MAYGRNDIIETYDARDAYSMSMFFGAMSWDVAFYTYKVPAYAINAVISVSVDVFGSTPWIAVPARNGQNLLHTSTL